MSFGASTVFAQSRIDLLQRVADHYSRASTFLMKGTASATIPGTSWRVSYEFYTEGAQPKFVPLSAHGPSIQVVSSAGHFNEVLAVPGAADPKPERKFQLDPFGRDNELALHLVDAKKIGAETITVQGRTYSCEVIDAIYDYSPGFKPHSIIVHKRLSIAPSDLLVLRERKISSDGFEWTAEVTSFSFDSPPSDMMLPILKTIAAQAKDRPDWVGHQVPDLRLPQLSGSSVSLAELRGRPILLDFWGSYCSPCRSVTLHAQELANQYKSSGLTVLTLTQDTAQDAKLWVDYNHMNLPVLLDPDGAAFKAFDVQGVPVTILFDENGKVIHYWVGLDDPSSMDSVLSATLHERAVSAVGSGPSH